MNSDLSAPSVDKVAEYATRHPRGYRARVLALASLGYLYLLGVVAVLALLLVGVAYLATFRAGIYALIKLAIPLLGLGWLVLRSLWIRLPEPEGILLEPREAPRLFAEIETVRRMLGAPRVHRVLLTDDVNAAAAQIPLLGFVGPQRNYLLLGLPYLLAVPLDEFRSVLAHELGHIGGNHARFSRWIYRLRLSWMRVLGALEQDGNVAGQLLFRRFFDWYAPLFMRYTLALAREREYEADRVAAGCTGAGTCGRALMRTHVASCYLGNAFWPDLWNETRVLASPPLDVFTRMAGSLRKAHEHPQLTEWMAEAARETTSDADTHPALTERLAALGLSGPVSLDGFDCSAAERLLGEQCGEFMERFGHVWAENAREAWRSEHETETELAGRLAELDGIERDGPLEPAERLERTRIRVRLFGPERVADELRERVEENPSDAELLVLLAHAYSRLDDERCVAIAARVMDREDGYFFEAGMLALAWLDRAGRSVESEQLRSRLAAREQLLKAAHAEREPSGLRHDDELAPHGLDEEALDELRSQLARFPGLARAYLVRRVTRYFPDEPHYLLAFDARWTVKRLWRDNVAEKLVQEVSREVGLPGTGVILTMEGHFAKLGKRIRKMPDAEIYNASRRVRVAASRG